MASPYLAGHAKLFRQSTPGEQPVKLLEGSDSGPKQDVKSSVDRSIVQVFSGFNLGPIEFINQRKEWSGDTVAFSLTAKLRFLQTPIRGSALVTDSEVIVDVDLGLLGKLIPEQTAKSQIENRTKGLLKN